MRTKEAGSTLEPQKLRELASWYRVFAERAGNSSILVTRLQMADELEREANYFEQEQQQQRGL